MNRTHRVTLLFARADVLERTRARTRFDANPLFAARLFPHGPFSAASQLLLPGLLATGGYDVFHSTNFMMPLAPTGRTRIAVTIHDLIPLLFPDHAPRSMKTRLFPLYRALMRAIGRRADLIVTVSEATRRDVLRELRIGPARTARVIGIPEGVEPAYRPAPRAPRAEKRILYVGRRDPYKNLPLLVEALALVRARGIPAQLQVIGPQDARYPEAPQRATALGVDGAIDWTGYVTPEALIAAYQQADVFCLPSRYEGFGLTVLEAMACGTPVVCSNCGSLPEVAGDAARLTAIDRPEPVADALSAVLTDDALAASLAQRGLARAAQFTWDRTAQETLRAYEGVQTTPPLTIVRR